jgi:hypothetical protein
MAGIEILEILEEQKRLFSARDSFQKVKVSVIYSCTAIITYPINNVALKKPVQ